jgi:hypothetical protein
VGHFHYEKSYDLILTKMGWATFLAHFVTNASGHPLDTQASQALCKDATS